MVGPSTLGPAGVVALAPQTPGTPRGIRYAALALSTAAVVLSGCGGAAASTEITTTAPGDSPRTVRYMAQPPDPAQARGLLAALPIRVEDNGAHYDRDDWGDWRTRAGCDTREQVLIRDGQDVTTGANCTITGGRWTSTYDGISHTDPADLEIDHRVPVREAQRSGARGWTREQRAEFYNDLANLTPITASVNSSRSDDDAGRWRPPDPGAWCGFATAYIATKHAYALHIDGAERDGLTAMLNACPADQGGAR
ncbi:HNH endonuclease family protein (plasmid) [Pseudonocardia sp. DSM 110487]|uniref:HNH endonuclease family protein n=1 Tax=Pseudonocardia sp. DSM 110487 TaxID=2865833 RepID=UPI001C69AEB1|nr:HNH endonuclease family protein [Pseudonocardia sp. DSM 110487]QYN41088.1 HNH endonuclease family protein [Pseudonocardia sp. DSM 110487]